jgi:hypothetical protein
MGDVNTIVNALGCLITGENRTQAESFLFNVETQQNFVRCLTLIIDSKQRMSHDIRFISYFTFKVNIDNFVEFFSNKKTWKKHFHIEHNQIHLH